MRIERLQKRKKNAARRAKKKYEDTGIRGVNAFAEHDGFLADEHLDENDSVVRSTQNDRSKGE
jgi:hypothetical protein